MPIRPGIAGCSSIFILTSLTLPLAARTAFSRTGVSCLHGPHHGAQKSTSTGWRLDSSMTSLTKVCVVVSLTDASAVAVPACCSIDIDLPDCPSLGPGGGEIRSIRLIKWEESQQMQSRFSVPGCGGCGHRLNSRQVPGSFEEIKEPVAGNRRRAGIHQRMKVEDLLRHHGGIEHDVDAA